MTIDQILATLVPEGDCLVWTRSRNPRGYGKVSFDGRMQGVHRVVFSHAHGPLPLGILVCHTCDNPPCARLDHLFAGTQRDNIHDARRKGRLRSVPPMAAVHAAKTHCPHGHPYSLENTYVTKRGARMCRECLRARRRAWGARNGR